MYRRAHIDAAIPPFRSERGWRSLTMPLARGVVTKGIGHASISARTASSWPLQPAPRTMSGRCALRSSETASITHCFGGAADQRAILGGSSISVHSPIARSSGSTNSAGPGSTALHASSRAASAWLTTLRECAARIWARVTVDRSASAESPSGPESWAMRPPVVAQATSPAMTSMGIRSRLADAMPVTTLVMPGPAVTTTAGIRPLARWNSAAANAAWLSWRDSTRRAPAVSRIASKTGQTGPPGMPKNVSTPRATSASTSRRAAEAGESVDVSGAAGVDAGTSSRMYDWRGTRPDAGKRSESDGTCCSSGSGIMDVGSLTRDGPALRKTSADSEAPRRKARVGPTSTPSLTSRDVSEVIFSATVKSHVCNFTLFTCATAQP